MGTSLPGQVLAWLSSPASWQGSDGIQTRLAEHIGYSLESLACAMVLAMPLGLYIGHTGRGGVVAINLAGIGRALPSFGIIILLVTIAGVGLIPPLVALVALAIP